MEKEIDFIKKELKELYLLRRSGALLGWDQQVNMPEKGAETRSEILALLSKLIHERFTSEKLFKAVERVRKMNLKGDDKLMIKRLYKDLIKSRKLPVDFVEEMSKAESIGFSKWQEAKKKKDFSIFKPYLGKIVELQRRKSKYYGMEGHPYNGLLDDYEEGMTVDELKPEFEKLKKGIIELLRKIEGSKKYKDKPKLLKKKFPREKQIEFSKDVVRRIGLAEDNSRIDFSEHPFSTTIGVNDVRITTNIRESPLFSFGSSMHEAGHSLYELGMPKEHAYDSLGDTPSLGIHESQSRFWENMIGKSKSFWKFYFPKFDKVYGLGGDLDEWYFEDNMVFPGKIRIESDEVHYPLHVILRFEIEMGLIDGSINVEELPKIWNEKMKEYFGVDIKNDSEGVMQDVHWSGGSFGYFPTYVLGTIYASQLYGGAKKEIKDLEKDVEKGDYGRIREWLVEKIHRQGRKQLAEELIKSVCGERLNVDIYLEYLNKKYSEIYKI